MPTASPTTRKSAARPGRSEPDPGRHHGAGQPNASNATATPTVAATTTARPLEEPNGRRPAICCINVNT